MGPAIGVQGQWSVITEGRVDTGHIQDRYGHKVVRWEIQERTEDGAGREQPKRQRTSGDGWDRRRRHFHLERGLSHVGSVGAQRVALLGARSG